jgi:hypothetical protein
MITGTTAETTGGVTAKMIVGMTAGTIVEMIVGMTAGTTAGTIVEMIAEMNAETSAEMSAETITGMIAENRGKEETTVETKIGGTLAVTAQDVMSTEEIVGGTTSVHDLDLQVQSVSQREGELLPVPLPVIKFIRYVEIKPHNSSFVHGTP